MHTNGRHLIAVAAAVAGLLCSPGCITEQPRISLEPVEMPEGGVVMTIAHVAHDGATHLVAPTTEHIYTRRLDAERWERRTVRWPDEIEASQTPLEGLGREATLFNHPRRQLFTAHGGKIWMLTKPSIHRAPVLLYSEDVGRSWSHAELPVDRTMTKLTPGDKQEVEGGSLDRAGDAGRVGVRTAATTARGADAGALDAGGGLDAGAPVDAGSADGGPPDAGVAASTSGGGGSPGVRWSTTRVRPSGSLRLRVANGSMYLPSPRRLWRMERRGEARVWQPLSLEGVSLEGTTDSRGFPPVIRNYLPDTEAREYEVLTVLSDQLLVYRRWSDTRRWVLSSTLATIDRSLVGVPGEAGVYLLTPDSVYRSSDDVESWNRSQFQYTPGGTFETIHMLPGEEPGGSPIALIGTSNGTIARSDDGGIDWEVVHPPDPDHRGITGMVWPSSEAGLWVSTNGRGVLQTSDIGESWNERQGELRATRALTLRRGPNQELLVGTESGLFRLTGAPRDGNWNRVHDHGTVSLMEGRDALLYSGTLGGAIVAQRPDGRFERIDGVALENRRNLLFEPSRLRDVEMPSPAIVAFDAAGDDRRVLAFTHQSGGLLSRDGGEHWSMLPLHRALEEALDTSRLVSAVVGRGGSLYLASRSIDGEAPAQVWHSPDVGESWHAVSLVGELSPQTPWFVLAEPGSPQNLLSLQGDTVRRSSDGATSWRAVRGPWEEAPIEAHQLEADRTALALRGRDAELAIHDGPISTMSADTTSRYGLQWPDTLPFDERSIVDLLVYEDFLFVRTPAGLYFGAIPVRQSTLAYGFRSLIVVIAMFLVTAAAFALLRRWAT